jgi:hypothetical protein
MNISEISARPHTMNAGRENPFVKGFASQLAAVGHSSFTINGYLGPAIHFGTWLKSRGLGFADVSEETIKAFATHRCLCPGTHKPQRISRVYTAYVQRFVRYPRCAMSGWHIVN